MKAVMERNEAVAEGRREGRREGSYSRQIRTARLMIAQGFDENSIHAVSELPVDEIRKLAGTLS